MAQPETEKRKRRKSHPLIDLALFAACCGLVWLLGAAATRQAGINSDIRIVEREARLLYDSFQTFYTNNEGYPGDYAGRALDPSTLDPLRKRGYYKGFIESRLLGERIDAFGSPDDRGLNQEFWVEMTLASSPSIRFLIARSDDAPLAGGSWRDGVYIFRRGELREL